jgi:hypothetical protein
VYAKKGIRASEKMTHIWCWLLVAATKLRDGLKGPLALIESDINGLCYFRYFLIRLESEECIWSRHLERCLPNAAFNENINFLFYCVI